MNNQEKGTASGVSGPSKHIPFVSSDTSVPLVMTDKKTVLMMEVAPDFGDISKIGGEKLVQFLRPNMARWEITLSNARV